MINKNIHSLILETGDDLVTQANNVSMVFEDNTLLHAIIILNNTTYTSVPVLDYNNKFKGLISTSQIFKFLGDKIHKGFEILEDYKVRDAIDTRYLTINENYTLEEAIRGLINYNFLCVVDDDGVFKGLITRSTILKKMNHMVHEFDKKYIVKDRHKNFFHKKVKAIKIDEKITT